MSLTTITIGLTDYTAYASISEAGTALAVDPTRSTIWASLTTEAKSIDLVAATNRLDLLSWAGSKTGGQSQTNAWPRSGLQRDGESLDSSTIPLEVERACILLAGSIALRPADSNAGAAGSASSTKRAQGGLYRGGVLQRAIGDD